MPALRDTSLTDLLYKIKFIYIKDNNYIVIDTDVVFGDRPSDNKESLEIRELFKKRYNGLEPNPKLPMPRAVGVWLKDWQGPTRPEFKKIDINEFKPDQKWLMFILEDFLNRLDAGEFNE